MLVLSRRIGERIHIGDEITVEVRRIAGNRVTLALRAPRDIRILRGELEQAAKEFEETPAGQPKANSASVNSQDPLIVNEQPADTLNPLSTHDSGQHSVI